MEIRDYTQALKDGKKINVAGLCGRILRGKKPADFRTMTDDPTRLIVMPLGPDGLHALLGKNGYEMLVTIGYEPTYIERKINEGNQFKLVVFQEGIDAKLATWDNAIALACQIYPDITNKLRKNIAFLKSTPFNEIEKKAGFDFSEVDKNGPGDENFMTYERFQICAGTPVDCRAFLYFTLHLRELYSGDGWTYDSKGNRGALEYIMPNMEIADLGDYELVDMEVILPTAKAKPKTIRKTGPPVITKTGGPRSPLPLPEWYRSGLIANPWYQPNADLIQRQAYGIAAKHGVKKASQDQFRAFRLHVDEQPDFLWPITAVDPDTGKVTRYLPPYVKGLHEIPDYWSEGNNEVVWIGQDFDPTSLQSVAGGRLSVAGAWNDTQREVEWDARNAHCITMHGQSADWHPLTARFDMHFWVARSGNPYGLPPGSHPYPFMDGPDQPFPIITPQNCWHPKHNPNGCWKPIVTAQKYLDETWEYVNALGLVVLWTKHCHRFTLGATIEPVVMANIMYHNFLRGWLEAEPAWYTKGVSWRTEYFGILAPEFEIADDENAQLTLNILQLFDGFPDQGILPFDLIIVTGQAASHCVLRTMQQMVKHIEESGRDEAIKKIIYLSDTSSTIIGFEEATEKAHTELQAKGVQMTTTKEFNLYAA